MFVLRFRLATQLLQTIEMWDTLVMMPYMLRLRSVRIHHARFPPIRAIRAITFFGLSVFFFALVIVLFRIESDTEKLCTAK